MNNLNEREGGLTQKQIFFAGLAHKIDLYQYLKVDYSGGKKKISYKSEYLYNFIDARNICYDKWIVDGREALHEANKYRRKWDLKNAAMYILCAWEMDSEISSYVDKNTDMIEWQINRSHIKKELLDTINLN